MTTAGIVLSLMSANVRSQLQYRMNFAIWLAVGIVFQLTGFFFLWALLARFHAVGGWTLEEVAFLYGLRLLAHALAVFVFGGTQIVDWMVHEGSFDQPLVRPVPMLLTVVTWFRPSSIGDLLGAVVLLSAAARVAPVDVSPLALVYLVFAVLGGMLLESGIRLAFASMSFRFVRTSALLFFADGLFSNFGNLPLRIFGGTVEILLTFVLPVAFVAYIPASVVLGHARELTVQPPLAYLAPLVGGLVFALAALLWRHELPQYQSSGT